MLNKNISMFRLFFFLSAITSADICPPISVHVVLRETVFFLLHFRARFWNTTQTTGTLLFVLGDGWSSEEAYHPTETKLPNAHITTCRKTLLQHYVRWTHFTVVKKSDFLPKFPKQWKMKKMILMKKYSFDVKEYFGSKSILKSTGGMLAVTNPACLCSIAQQAKLSVSYQRVRTKRK